VSQHRENIRARSADGEYGKLNTAAIAAENQRRIPAPNARRACVRH